LSSNVNTWVNNISEMWKICCLFTNSLKKKKIACYRISKLFQSGLKDEGRRKALYTVQIALSILKLRCPNTISYYKFRKSNSLVGFSSIFSLKLPLRLFNMSNIKILDIKESNENFTLLQATKDSQILVS